MTQKTDEGIDTTWRLKHRTGAEKNSQRGVKGETGASHRTLRHNRQERPDAGNELPFITSDALLIGCLPAIKTFENLVFTNLKKCKEQKKCEVHRHFFPFR